MNQRPIAAILLVAVPLLAVVPATSALGADLTFSAGASAEYDDNVFRRERNVKDDFLFRLNPAVRLHEDRGGDLNYSLLYNVPIEFAARNNDELNDLDHILRGKATYHVSDRLELFGTDRFGLLRSTRRQVSLVEDDVVAGSDFLEISEQRDEVTTNQATLGAVYRFTPRTTGRVSANSSYFDSTRDDRSRVLSIGGSAGADYALTARHQLGAGFGYSHQDFDERVGFEGSQTDSYQLYASWLWQISETLGLQVQAGPTYLETEQEDAAGLRTANPVPFFVLPASTLSGFFDRNGAQITTPRQVPAGSLLVPSFQVIPAGTSNCSRADGVSVPPCSVNVLLDAGDPTDAATISALQSTRVPITNSNPGGASDSSLDFFVEASLRKSWTPTFASALRYVRQEGGSSGLGGAVILDAVSLSNTWDIFERWQLALRGDWTRRESLFDFEQTFDQLVGIDPAAIPGAPAGAWTNLQLAGRCTGAANCTAGRAFNSTRQSQIDTERWSVAGRITHQLFRSTIIWLQVRYDEQQSNRGSLGRSSDFENLLATFGVRHTFEPIKLW